MKRRTSNNPSVQLSKSLSWLLRHGAEKEGFQLLPGGFLYVESILQKPQFSKYTLEDVQSIVASNDKQRFYMETEPETGHWKIRANQGHSLQVAELKLEPITNADQFPVVVHGTYYKFWESIRRQGLKRMRRTHVHFASGEPGETGVISGMRGSCDLMIYLDLEKAIAGGLKFFRSANNVILTEGNEAGTVTPDYFKKVLDRKSGKEIDVTHSGQDSMPDKTNGMDQTSLCAASPASVSADDLADEMDNQRKQRRKKKNAC